MSAELIPELQPESTPIAVLAEAARKGIRRQKDIADEMLELERRIAKLREENASIKEGRQEIEAAIANLRRL